jgi:hypothetical protein
VAAVAALLAATAPAAAQDPYAGSKWSGETTVWQATLTPIHFSDADGGLFIGCSDTGTGRGGVGDASCSPSSHEGATWSTWLTTNSLALSGQTYRILEIGSTGAGGIEFVFDKPIPDALLTNMNLEINPYVQTSQITSSVYVGFAPGWDAPSGGLRHSLDSTGAAQPDGTQAVSLTTGGPTDWRTSMGTVTMRITYVGTPPDLGAGQPESPTGYVVPGYNPPPQGQGGGAGDTGKQQQPEPVDITPPEEEDSGQQKQGGQTPPDGQHQPQRQGGVGSDNGSPEPADPAPPQRPALDGAAADYDADGDGRISSDEYQAGAADYGDTKLSVKQILQIRQAYIDSQK